ncbi:hypothetical protein BC936DRAFT_147609 [Jimgerdemannia flammicorona]|uniref:Uncharacterized protein n=1 Tax=Jimgerdemannia flammicorona TaxID=994334 RepID=A0A433D528_9FUNG|nr:hypothetical protein BC936DRAFT_147609 [Jimgerdemannia flammicorona]
MIEECGNMHNNRLAMAQILPQILHLAGKQHRSHYVTDTRHVIGNFVYLMYNGYLQYVNAFISAMRFDQSRSHRPHLKGLGNHGEHVVVASSSWS